MTRIITGDCLDVMPTLEANSIDSVICDPPYGLDFMGKAWDHGVPGTEFWQAALRVAKPGAILMAFGGTRTFHRLACAIEDAGWEIRDCMMFLYGTGFPKSLQFGCKCGGNHVAATSEHDMRSMRKTDIPQTVNVGNESREVLLSRLPEQGIQEHGTERQQPEPCDGEESCLEGRGDVLQDARELQDGQVRPMSEGVPADGSQGRVCDGASPDNSNSSRPLSETDGGCSSSEPRPEGQSAREPRTVPEQPSTQSRRGGICPKCGGVIDFRGYGSSLKPAWEPIIVAMKPLEGTYAENAQKWGVAGLNIDGGRIGTAADCNSKDYDDTRRTAPKFSGTFNGGKVGQYRERAGEVPNGRFPANLLLDEDSARLLPGGASRFFYTAKASSSERNAGLEGVMTWESVDLKEDLQKVLSLVRDTSDVLIPLQDGSAWRTILYGSNTTDLSLMAMKSTIETVTSLIIGLRTSNFCLTSTTRDSILDAIRTLTADGSSLASIVDRLNQLIPNTTNEQTVSALGAVLAVLRTLLPISEKGRHGNIHSTVKPLDLMRYLCKLTKTPTGGVVLDPFMGSGTTGVACVLEGRDFIGIELNQEYVEIARKRVQDAVGPLFAVES